MRKLLSKPTGSAHEPPAGEPPGPSSFPLIYRPNGPQEAVHQVGVPIASLDRSPDGRSAVLGGRHVLKTVRFDGLNIKEVFDLRALITVQSSLRANSTVSISDHLGIRDVKWGTGRSEASIFTACVTGKIFQYDLARLGAQISSGGSSGAPTVDFIQTHEQESSRQINTLDINPHKDAYLLSGGQDGYVRLYDTQNLVETRFGPTFRPMQVFKCNGDVRHAKWSPKHGFYFACCTDQGAVLKWDIRKSTAPVLRIAAHEKAASSIAWHPDGEHLISGGVDKRCYVWDFSKSADKRQKPKWSLHTPASVAAVSWRPGQWSATYQGLRAAQVAVSYDVKGPKRPGINAVHIWDFGRPTIPYKTVERFECSPSALLWKDQEFLWTAGEDGLFCQSDITFAPRVIDRTAVSTLSFSSCGDVLTFLDERPPAIRPRVLASMHKDLPSATAAVAAAAAAAAAASSSSHGSDSQTPTPTLNISRSDSEGDVTRGFLMPRRRMSRKRRASSIQPLGSTPPSSGDSANGQNLIIPLETALGVAKTFRNQQIMAIGHIPSAARKDVYGYLATQYLEALEYGLPSMTSDITAAPLPERVATILDSYAHAAENVSQFRLAQVWRIIGFAMNLLLQSRAQYHQQKRLEYLRKTPAKEAAQTSRINGHGNKIPYSKNASGTILDSASTEDDGSAGNKNGPLGISISSRTLPVRSLLTEEIESTSNVATPLVRPVSNGAGLPSIGEDYYENSSLGNAWDGIADRKNSLHADVVGSFNLPEARYSHQEFLDSQPRRRHLDSMPISEESHGSGDTHFSSTEGYDFYDTEAIAKAIDVPGATERTPAAPALDFMESQNSHGSQTFQSPPKSPTRVQFLRQDSTDSTGGGIFEISQTSGYGADDYDGGSAASAPKTNKTQLASALASAERRRGRSTSAATPTAAATPGVACSQSFSQSQGHGVDSTGPGPPTRKATIGSVSSVGSSSRLLRLNRALMSLEWSGSDLTSAPTGRRPSLGARGLGETQVVRDTYYRTNSQDTEESNSSNSFLSPTPLNGTAGLAPGRPKTLRHQQSDGSSSRLGRSSSSLDVDKLMATVSGTISVDASSSERITDRDYLPWPNDPPYPFPRKTSDDKNGGGHSSHGSFDTSAVLDPYVIVKRALAFEVRTSPLHAAAMVLLLQPLVPDDVLDPLQAQAIVRQHHARLMGMKLFLEAALLRKLCGRQDLGQQQLLSKTTQPGGGGASYKAVIAPAQHNVSASYLCPQCLKPREKDDHSNPAVGPAGRAAAAPSSGPLWKPCERCKAVLAPCAVCGHRDVSPNYTLHEKDQYGLAVSEDEENERADAVLSTWWYCVGCGHGGHTSCLEDWHSSSMQDGAGTHGTGASSPRLRTLAGDGGDDSLLPDAGTGTEFSDGCCPLDGCGHACLPGQWRTETIAARSEELAPAIREAAAAVTSSGSALSRSASARSARDKGPTRDQQDRNGDRSAGSNGVADVRADGHDVGPSRAVDLVRESLAGGSRGGEGLEGRLLSSSPRRNASTGALGGEVRERERRKSVKFASTD